MSSLPHPEPPAARPRPLGAPAPPGRSRAALDADYDYPTCREFAANLSDATIGRAAGLFALLAERGVADADEAAAATGLRPRDLASQMTGPLRRHADGLGLPLPFILEVGSDPDAARWHDRAGIAVRMGAALRDERASRPSFATTDVTGAYRRASAPDPAPIPIPLAREAGGPPDLAAVFEPLAALLEARSKDAEVTLTFGQIEAIVGAELPPIARRSAAWWADAADAGTARLWQRVGRAASVGIEARSVTFGRTDAPVRRLVVADPPAAAAPSPVAAPIHRRRAAHAGRVVGRLVHGLAHPRPAAQAGDS